MAKALGLSREEPPPARLRLELGGDAPEGAAVVDVYLGEDNRAIGKRIDELSLPPEVVIAAVLRGKQMVTPRGSTVFVAGDHVYLIGSHLHTESIPTAFGRKWHGVGASVRPVGGDGVASMAPLQDEGGGSGAVFAGSPEGHDGPGPSLGEAS